LWVRFPPGSPDFRTKRAAPQTHGRPETLTETLAFQDRRRSDRLFTVDLDKDTLKRYPEFHRESFIAMSDEESRRYEWRVLEAIDPQAARSSTREWDYDRLPYYRQPEWFDRDLTRPAGRPIRSETSRARQVPIVERTDRERIMAREDMPESDRSRERPSRPKGDDF
jgi:hypothetical protein